MLSLVDGSVRDGLPLASYSPCLYPPVARKEYMKHYYHYKNLVWTVLLGGYTRQYKEGNSAHNGREYYSAMPRYGNLITYVRETSSFLVYALRGISWILKLQHIHKIAVREGVNA